MQLVLALGNACYMSLVVLSLGCRRSGRNCLKSTAVQSRKIFVLTWYALISCLHIPDGPVLC